MFKMYCLWASIAEEQAFPGRCADEGDAIGERLITTRIINKLMKLLFLLEKVYFPYSKWFGTAFKDLKEYAYVKPIIETALGAATYEERNQALCLLYQQVGVLHNNAGITPQVSTDIVRYHSRPYEGMDAELFSDALFERVGPELSGYDIRLLSKTVLYDDSNFGSYKGQVRAMVEAAKIAT